MGHVVSCLGNKKSTPTESIPERKESAYEKGVRLYSEGNNAYEKDQEVEKALNLFEKATEHLTQALRDSQDDIRIKETLGIVYKKQGYILERGKNDKIGAQKSYQKAEALGQSSGSKLAEEHIPSKSGLLFKSNPTPVEKEEIPIDIANPKTTEELALLLKKPLRNKNSPLDADLLAKARAVISLFDKEGVKDKSLIQEVSALAAVEDEDVISHLISRLVKAFKIDTALLEPDLLEGITKVFREAEASLIRKDVFVDILSILLERLKSTHKQFHSKDNLSAHVAILQTLSKLLDAMVDVGVEGLSRTGLHEPVYDKLDAYFEGTYPWNVDVPSPLFFLAHYCRQALVRIRNDESNWKKFFRKSTHLGKSAWAVAQVLKLNLGQLVTVYEEGKAFFKNQDSEQDWYDNLRYATLLVDAGNLRGFEDWVKNRVLNSTQQFLYGTLNLIDSLVDHPDKEVAFTALELLKQCSDEITFWFKERTLLERAKDLKNTRQFWSKEEDFKKEIERRMAHHARHFDPVIRDKAQSFLSTFPDLTGLPRKDLATLPMPSTYNSTKLIRGAAREAYSIGGLLETQRLAVLNREKEDETLNLDLYITSMVRRSENSKESFDLLNEVDVFLKDETKQALLLLGSSGTGKSLFGRYLEKTLWQRIPENRSLTKEDVIPLFISLTEFLSHSNENELLEKVFAKLKFKPEQIEELKTYNWLFILDGYDEIRGSVNLYKENALDRWKGKVLFSCRKEYLLSSLDNYRDLFVPYKKGKVQNSGLTEKFLTSFSEQQIEDYLKRYVKESVAVWKNWEEYRDKILMIPGVAKIIKNPYVLSITVEVLPEIAKTHAGTDVLVTRTELYNQFLKQWLQRQFEKLTPQQAKILGIDRNKTVRNWLQDLADLMFRKRVYPAYYDSKSPEAGEWKPFFESDEKTLTIRLCSPLRKKGDDKYDFLHKSLYEFLVPQAFIQTLKRQVSSTKLALEYSQIEEIEEKNLTQSEIVETVSVLKQDLVEKTQLNQQLINQEDGILKFYVEMVEKDFLFKEYLLSLIERSKKDHQISIGAANAMTILNASRFNFSGKDLRGVQIPYADLSYGLFDRTDFTGANLKGVNLQGAWLREACLRGANLENIELGELPYLNHGREVCQVFDNKGEIIFSDSKGTYCFDHKTFTTKDLTNNLDGSLIAFNEEDNLLVLEENGTIKLWDLEKRQSISSIDIGSKHKKITFSSSGIIAFLNKEKTDIISVWDFNKKEKIASLEVPRMDISDESTTLNLNRSGEFLISGNKNKESYLWNIKKGTHIALKGHKGSITCTAFSSDGKLVASGAEDKTIKIWNAGTGECVATLEGHRKEINALKFDQKGERLLSASLDKTVRIWDLPNKKCISIFSGHTDKINSISFDQREEVIISGSDDKTIRFWKIDKKNEEGVYSEKFMDVFAIHEKSDQMALASQDNAISLYDSKTGSCLFQLGRCEDTVYTLAFDSKGEKIASISRDKIVRIWDVRKRECVAFFEADENELVFEDNHLILIRPDKGMRVWDIEKKQFVSEIFWAKNKFNTLILGNLYFAGAKNRAIEIWDAKKREFLFSLEGNRDVINTLRFNTDSTILAAGKDCSATLGGDGGLITLWDIEKKSILFKLKGHTASVTHIAFDLSGEKLVSVSDDKTIRIWDLKQKECIGSLEGYNGTIIQIAFDSNGEHLTSLDEDGSLRFWGIEKNADQTVNFKLLWSTSQNTLIANNSDIVLSENLSKESRLILRRAGAEEKWDSNILQNTISKNSHFIPHLENWQSILSYPIKTDNIDLFNILIEEGLNLNLGDEDSERRMTALIYSASKGSLKILKELIMNGSEKDFKDKSGCTALMFASLHGHVECVKELLEKGADVNLKNKNGETALMVASRYGHVECMKELLEKGANVDTKDNDGWSALMFASRNGHVECVKELIEKGADVDAKANDGWTALMYAHLHGHVECAKELIEKGADIDVKEDHGWAALMVAVAWGHLECVKELLEKGADVDAKDNNGETALIFASQNGHVECVKELIEKGADVDAKDNNGWSALMFASQNGHIECVTEIVEKGADVNLKNNNGETALIFASQNGHVECVKELLEKGADVNLKANNGATALMFASQNGHVECVKELIEKGAQIDLQKQHGWIALTFAAAFGHIDCLKELLAHRKDLIDHDDEDDDRPLMQSAFHGRLDCMKELLDQGTEINHRNKIGKTALIWAAKRGQEECVKELLLRGADFNLKTKEGKTALDVASENSHEGCVELLKNGLDLNTALI